MNAWRLQIYVLGRFLVGVGAALATIASVIVLIDFVEVSRTLGGGRFELSFAQLFHLTLLKSPAIILLLLPFVFLFGTMGAFVAMNRRSELVAMRAAGVSAWRFILPAAAAAFVIGVATTTVFNPAAAALNAQYEDRQAAIAGGSGAADEIWLRQGDDRQQVVIHARNHDTVNDVVRLRGVSVFIETVDPSGALSFARRLEAAEGDLMPGYWRLSDVREALPGSGQARSDRMSIPSMLDHRTAMEKFVSPGAVAFWRLPPTIHAAELAGYSATGYRLRLQQLLAAPLLFAAMAVLGAGFSLRLMRLGDLAALAGAGVALGFMLFFVDEFCGALGAAEVIPAGLAAWSPPILALLAGVTLLCYTEDG